MSADLVARLRELLHSVHVLVASPATTYALVDEAADEIERLRMVELNRNADLSQARDEITLANAAITITRQRAEQAEARLLEANRALAQMHAALGEADAKIEKLQRWVDQSR